MKTYASLSRQALLRLPGYYNYFVSLRREGVETVSSPTIARALGLNDVQVRKDLASVSSRGGRPKTGFDVVELMRDIEHCLGYDHIDEAVLVGVGQLGRALLSYPGFEACGVRIVAAFDRQAFDEPVAGKRVFGADKMRELCRRMGVRIGIIAVPADAAQSVCDTLVAGGVQAIWNFAPVYLKVSGATIVKNENMAASLAMLSHQLMERQTPRREGEPV